MCWLFPRFFFLVGCALAWVAPLEAFAQTAPGTSLLVKALQTKSQQDSVAVQAFLKQHGQQKRGMLGSISYELVGVERGRPIFMATHNAAAALAAGIPEVRSGGWVGLDLQGSGINVGVWDAGTALPTHLELAGRVTVIDTAFPPATHASHVSGTIAAVGARATAKGMAPHAQIVARDWQNDRVEMAEAGAEEFQVSNHSYGSFGGWVKGLRGTGRWSWLGDISVSQVEEFRFGRYDEQASDWDAIAFQAPDYVIVKSAGNDRGEGPSEPGAPYDLFDGGWIISTVPRDRDGGTTGYDTLLDAGVSKNVITVGAVEDLQGSYNRPSDVVMTSFSAWGPTDDGRIKPDLVANGTSVYSSTAGWNEAYAYSSGTSMAAPVVTGIVALVQEAFRTLAVRPPSSATVKAVLIHSADQAGPALGPDYQFGWGLVNAAGAVSLIQDEANRPGRIIRGELAPGESTTVTLIVPDGGALEATVAWTDPAAEAGGLVLNDRRPALINDLDLSIDGPGGPWLPFVLDPNNPHLAATRAINLVDNVERVHVPAVAGGTYVVNISLSPGASSTQPFSLVVGPTRTGASSTPSLAGTLDLDGQPIPGALVSAGSVSVTTAADGTFIFPILPEGETVVIPDARYQFDPSQVVLRIPETSFVSFSASSGSSISSVQLLSGPNLLRGGAGATINVPTAAAGGVYGLDVFLNTDVDLSGGQLVADFSASPFTSSYAGDRARGWRASSTAWKITAVGDGRFWKRFPLVWIAPGMQGDARVPTKILDSTGRLVGTDTLTWTTDRDDDVPPAIFHRLDVAGRGFVEPGHDLIIRADIIDGSRVPRVSAVLRDRDTDRVYSTVPLRDSGAWSADADAVRNDRLFSAILSPRLSADYAVDLTAMDAAGNESILNDAWHFSTRQFAKQSRYLLATWSEVETGTDQSRLALSEAGVAHDSWEFDVRGQIPDTLLTSYDGVVWLWNPRSIDRGKDRAQIEDLILRGVPMVLVGSQLSRDEWLAGVSRIRRSAPVSSQEASGSPTDSVWQTVSLQLSEPGSIGSWEGDGNFRALLQSGERVVAAAQGALVVSSIPALRVRPEDRSRYLLSLLASATGDPALTGQQTSIAPSALPVHTRLSPPYPNPASHTATVILTLQAPAHVSMEVFDLLGRRVARVLEQDVPAGELAQDVQVSGLAGGIYFLAVTSGEAQLQQVLVVRH